MIGVASVTPLVYLMLGEAQTDSVNQPWFNIQISYGYRGIANNSSILYYSRAIVLNCTLNVGLKNEAEDRIEYYQVIVSSGTTSLEKANFCFVTYGPVIQSKEEIFPEFSI